MADFGYASRGITLAPTVLLMEEVALVKVNSDLLRSTHGLTTPTSTRLAVFFVRLRCGQDPFRFAYIFRANQAEVRQENFMGGPFRPCWTYSDGQHGIPSTRLCSWPC